MTEKPQILLTNDDGIESPGLWAAAEALSEIGYVWVVAPREQFSAAGRSMPTNSDGIITEKELIVHGKAWTVYGVGGSPAQAVQHAILEVIGKKPDLVVSGINYGLNLGTGVTVSGTVGAALEAATFGIKAMAVSLDTESQYHLSYSTDIEFQCAANITAKLAKRYLTGGFDPAMQVLKVEVPSEANEDTPIEIARLATRRYYLPSKPNRTAWSEPGSCGYVLEPDVAAYPEDSDVYVTKVKGHVALTPMTLDMTANIDFNKLKEQIS